MNAAELYSLDPSYRTDVLFCGTEDTKSRSEKIYNAIKDDVFTMRLRQLTWEALQDQLLESDRKVNSEEMSGKIRKVLEETGYKEVLTNAALKIYERSSALFTQRSQYDKSSLKARRSSDEQVESIRDIRINWESGINEELQTIASETKNPFSSLRPEGIPNPLLEQHATPPSERENIRFLFDSGDLLETAASIKSVNMNVSSLSRSMGLIKVSLVVPTLQELIQRYVELGPSYSQVGLDDLSQRAGSAFCYNRHEEADTIIAGKGGGALGARNYLKRGCPPSLRSKMWRIALGLAPTATQDEVQAFEALKRSCDRVSLLTDELYVMDVFSVTDDTSYFVFEDELRLAALAFSRDQWILQNCEYEIHKPLMSEDPAAPGQMFACPPSGVQPFLGLAGYFAPLGYIYRDPVEWYSVIRLMYTRIWCRMNVLSSDSNTLLTVCKCFESLVASVNMRLLLHLNSIGVQPLKIVFSWLQLGFVGTLEVDQILILWDRVIGFMDVTILAVLAAAIFLFRAEPLMQCTKATEVEALLDEVSRLSVVPLLQMFLFDEESA